MSRFCTVRGEFTFSRTAAVLDIIKRGRIRVVVHVRLEG